MYVKSRIQQRYNPIINSIELISDAVLPKSNFRHFLKPYWDRSLKDLHAIMRQARRVWISDGRPRGNNYDSYRKYKRAKSMFRSHHRRSAENYLASLNAEIDNAAEIESAFFWEKIKSRRKLSMSRAENKMR